MQASDTQAKITALGTEAKPGSPADFAAFIAAQHRKWTEVGKAAGVKIN
jgi:tripartite-type tricarboxylate transporter receptor subunit TctC